ncbi:Ca-activated chloride channel family protein [Shimia isoporae]|uniref:Ca-activated chloride channel family protein n=1 Tax=Shimia isoporae TaxID=647720 RepID=A0A4R1N2Y5_9RHOB|nr:VWA domain-containing protein [Shimia isoporae]TCL00761.1 Ca-activated chloride channel family protein [Shimia isoporae]
MIDWAHPFAFALLPLPIILRWLLPAFRQQDSALRLPFFRSLAEAAGVTPREGAAIIRHRRVALIGGAAIWVLAVAALAAPERLGPPQEITKAKRDVVLAIDISGSMDTRDFPGPDGTNQQRFQTVQQVVDQFVQSRDGDRVALIVFGTKAYVQSPLTEDLTTVRDLLERTEVGMAGPQTALGDAIGLAIHTFEASDIDQRLMVILSDGNDTSSTMSPINAAEIARDKGVQIFGVGVGDPEATGENRLDMAVLKDVTRRTGGQAYFAGDAQALEEIYDQIDALNPRDVETLSWRQRESLMHWPLLAAIMIGLGLTFALQASARRMSPAPTEGAT